MDSQFDSTDRRPGDLARFALGFIGFLIASGGVVLAWAGAAILGALIFLLVIVSFAEKRAADA
jgi:hypothetical protein